MKIAEVLVGALLALSGLTAAFAQQSGKATQGTQKPRRHHWNISTSPDTIPQLLAGTTGELIVRGSHVSEVGAMPVNPPEYPPYDLIAMACSADAAVLGSARTGTSHLTSDEHFLYTDWALTVEEVLKDNAKAPIATGSTISVSQPGGTLTIGGRTVRAIETDFREFDGGGRYFLFLRYLPGSDAYEASAENGFELKNNQVIRLTRNILHPRIETEDPETLIVDAKAAIAAQIHQCAGGTRHP